VDELNALGNPDGINTYNAYRDEHFGLRAYAVLFSGDGPAISEAIGMKAPGNAIKPCRFCEVKATKAPNNHWYIPHPKNLSATNRQLRLRTNLRETLKLAAASGAGDIEGMTSPLFRTRLILLGITRRTVLLDLPTLHFPRSFAIDLMHCILINIVPTLWDIWTAEHFKTDDIKDASDNNYLFSKKELDIFEEIIQDSRGNIPSVIGTMPRSFRWRHRWKAVEWRMLLEQFGTTLTNGHLPEKAHRNFCDLRQIWAFATQYSLDANDVAVLDQTARKFIKGYEQLYYYGDPERMTCCKINNHMLLHIASCIQDNGSGRYWWSFPVERFCFEARSMATSKSQITTSVNNSLIRRQQLALLSLANHLGNSGEDELSRSPVLKNSVNLLRNHE
jgi:hypothetical protein